MGWRQFLAKQALLKATLTNHKLKVWGNEVLDGYPKNPLAPGSSPGGPTSNRATNVYGASGFFGLNY